MEGKQVLEVVPVTLPDKASSFVRLIEGAGLRAGMFIGDDLADASIFREIRRRRAAGFVGLSVGVVDEETPLAVREAADLTLGGVDEVETFLEVLADRMTAERPLT
jgi:hypothetical protein